MGRPDFNRERLELCPIYDLLSAMEERNGSVVSAGFASGSVPVGSDLPILEKMQWACRLHDAYGDEVLADNNAARLLERYRLAIDETWKAMDAAGVLAECADCAVNDGGSCCGSGIENRFDTILLFINLIMGCPLPQKAVDATGCWFLGETGCRITARHVICVNYVCRRLAERLDEAALRQVQCAMVRESDAGFMLEEFLKKWLKAKVR